MIKEQLKLENQRKLFEKLLFMTIRPEFNNGRLIRSFCSSFYSCFGVSAVPVVSFRWFRFGVPGFSTCPTALKSAKRMTQWSAFYFKLSTSYYPVPSTQIHLQDFPRMTQQNLLVMSSAEQDMMRNWANTNGKCVRQRTVREETTQYKAGALPLNMYQTAVHRGERQEFAPVERVEQPEF